MNDNDKYLKDMWNKAENLKRDSNYESQTIQHFISTRSNSVVDKIRKMVQLDIALKSLFAALLAVDASIYYSIQPTVSLICVLGVVISIPLIMLQVRVVKRINQISDFGQSTKEKLAQMLTFLRSRFFSAILSISSTYIFLFTSGLLMYFYLTYGELRRLGNMDIFVFSTFVVIGVVMNFASTNSQVNYHIKHIEACLSDLNDNILAVVTNNIEMQQKQDRTSKMLFGLVLIFGFLVLIALLKKMGF